MMRRIPAVLIVVQMIAMGADWLTDGKNSQRTNWQEDEKILSKANAKDIKLLWKIKLPNETRQMHSLFVPLIVDRVNTRSGPKQILIETGVSDNIFAIDAETGEVIWTKHFSSSYVPLRTRDDILCPGGITATPVIATSDQRRGRRRCGGAVEVHASQRQAVCTESFQRSFVHAYRAGLRRQPE